MIIAEYLAKVLPYTEICILNHYLGEAQNCPRYLMNFEILKTDGSQIQVEPPKDKMTLVIVEDNKEILNEELFEPDNVVLKEFKDLKNLKVRFEPDFQFNENSVYLLEFKYSEKEDT